MWSGEQFLYHSRLSAALNVGLLEPLEVHDWYMGMYVDSVEWVTLPNVLGMSQFADGGLMASKPYAATGSYVKRMSNYCTECRFSPGKATGDDACPFTVLYWDYLVRHRERLASSRRMVLQIRNLDRKSDSELMEVRRAAGRILEADQA